MPKLSIVMVGIASTVLTILPLPAKAASLAVDQIFIFDESLADTGNLYNITLPIIPGGIPASPPYWQGRFSNGPLWTEYLASDYGLNLTLSTNLPGGSIPQDGINFAIAGAKTDDTHITGNPLLPGLQQQVDLFTGLLGGQIFNNPKALAVIGGGGNDFFAGQINPEIPASNVVNEIQRLIDAGLNNFLVLNLPDLGKTPLGLGLPPQQSAGLTALSQGYNFYFNQKLAQLKQSNPNINLFRLDLDSLFNDVTSNPGQFGFTNVTEGCTNIAPINLPTLPNPLYNPNCSSDLAVQNQFLFFDNQHPTTTGHRVIANAASEALQVPESSPVWALGLLGLGLLLNRSFSVSEHFKQKKSKTQALRD